MSKTRRERDPLMDQDPWLEALKNEGKASSSKDQPPPFISPDVPVQLILQVWINDDGSHPPSG